jgi:hypothetical protein
MDRILGILDINTVEHRVPGSLSSRHSHTTFDQAISQLAATYQIPLQPKNIKVNLLGKGRDGVSVNYTPKNHSREILTNG